MKRLHLADGGFVNHPTAMTTTLIIDNLGPDIDFLTLVETTGGFVQVAWGPYLGAPEGTLVLEAKGVRGPAHESTVVTDRAVVCAAFAGFLADDRAWVEALDWAPVEPGG